MFNCCLPPVSEIIGWQLCSEMSYPDPASGLVFPLTGPLRVAVTLTKQDRGLQQYVLEAAYNYIAQVPLAHCTLALVSVCYSGDRVVCVSTAYSTLWIPSSTSLFIPFPV